MERGQKGGKRVVSLSPYPTDLVLHIYISTGYSPIESEEIIWKSLSFQIVKAGRS
jgi:hypothetical protein